MARLERSDSILSRLSIVSAQSFEFQDEESRVTAGRWDGLPKHLRMKESSHNPHHHEATSVPFGTKFSLLFCKDLKLAQRRKKLIGLETGLPIFCVVVLSVYVGFINSTIVTDTYTAFNLQDMTIPFEMCTRILLAPNTTFTNEIAQDLNRTINVDTKAKYTFEVVPISSVNQTSSTVCGAVVFRTNYNEELGKPDFPRDITYDIRLRSLQRTLLDDRNRNRPFTMVSKWATDYVFSRDLSTGPRERESNNGGVPGYWSEGFLFLQRKVDNALILLISNHVNLLKNQNATRDVRLSNQITGDLVRFPYPPFHNADIVHMLDRNLPLVMLIGVSVVVLCNTWLLVQEKVAAQWFLGTFGISQGILWGSWIFREMIIHTLVSGIMTGILCTDWHYNGFQRIAFIDKANPSVVFIFLVAFYFNLICLSIAISVFFSNATNALTCAGFLNIFFYLPFIYVEPNYELLPLWTRYLLSISAPSGISFGCQQLALAEVNTGGTKWETLFDVDFGLGHITIMMIVGGCLAILFSLYVSSIYPTQYVNQIPLPLTFFLKKWWWQGHLQPDKRDAPIDDLSFDNAEFFEIDPPGLRKEVHVHRLSKCFPRDVGIFNITMNFFDGETAVILGGPLSGKSTLMAVITGNMSSTRGTVFINKHNVHKEKIYARSNLGICPENDILFGYLTVEEIISFFVQLKGVVAISEAFEEVGRLVRDLEMGDLRKVMAAKLSYTQKRLLHIAIAFGGGSKVVLLDEPTQRMDHASKRIAWRFIEKEKERRCIIVLTASAEEAYFLSDRLAILVDGEILCRGSLSFVNAKFGGGYHVIIKKRENFNRFPLETMLHRLIPDAVVASDYESEIELYLPRECSPYFQSFFQELESAEEKIGYLSYTITHRTTEEVYRQAGQQSESHSKNEFKRRHTVYKTDSEALFGEMMDAKYNIVYFYYNQFLQLFMKNARFSFRRWHWFIIPYIFPIIMIAVTAYVITTDPFDRNLPALNFDKLHLDAIGTSAVFLKCDPKRLNADGICEEIESSIAQLSMKSESVIQLEDIQEKIVNSYDITSVIVETGHILAVEVSFVGQKIHLDIYFNNQPLHVPPIAVNLMSNIMLRHLVRCGNDQSSCPNHSDYKISVVNHPMEYSNLHKLGLSEYFYSSGFFFGLILSWGMSFLVPMFIVAPIREKIFKHLQIMCGVNLIIFWTTKLLWDIICFACICLGICLVTFYFKTDGFNNTESIYALAALIMIFGICAIGIVNCLVPLFKSSGIAGYFYTWFVFFVIGPVPMSIVLNSDTYLGFLHYLFLILPNYAFGMGVFQMYSFSKYTVECPKIEREDMTELCRTEPSHGCCVVTNQYHSFSVKGVGNNDLCIVIVGILAHLFAFFMDTQLFHSFKLAFLRWKLINNPKKKLDEGVLTEHRIGSVDNSEVAEFDQQNKNLNINNLSSLPGKGTLENLDLVIKRNECFGLIGVEGCGIETLIPLLVGKELPATGDIYIEGGSITLTKNFKKFLNHFGYCQQYPSLMPELTGKEILKLFGTLRWIPPKLMHAAITTISVKLVIIHELENLVADFNPSSLKKLATAVALIGGPDFLIFHEPMRDIDQSSRIQIIDAINFSRKKSCVVIAAADVDICESLCNRLAIIVNGKIRCIGSPEYLKNAFCKGYTITAKLIPNEPYLYEKNLKMFDRDTPLVEDQGEEYEEIDDFDDDISDTPSFSHIPIQKPPPGNPKSIGSATSIPPWLKPPPETELLKKESPISPEKKLETDSLKITQDSLILSTRMTMDPDDLTAQTVAGFNVPRFERSQGHLEIFSDPRLQYWERELIPLMEFMEDGFPGAELVNIYPCFVHYQIKGKMELSYIFRQMEKARVQLDLESFTVGQASLQQICINFTGGQKVQKEMLG